MIFLPAQAHGLQSFCAKIENAQRLINCSLFPTLESRLRVFIKRFWHQDRQGSFPWMTNVRLKSALSDCPSRRLLHRSIICTAIIHFPHELTPKCNGAAWPWGAGSRLIFSPKLKHFLPSDWPTARPASRSKHVQQTTTACVKSHSSSGNAAVYISIKMHTPWISCLNPSTFHNPLAHKENDDGVEAV